jgi:hypothetical protein
MRRWQAQLAAALSALYLALAVLAAACLFTDTSAAHAAGHHHQKAASHSALCLWACQGSPTVELPSATAPGQLVRVIAVLRVASESPIVPSAYESVQSRAPPFC